LKKHNSGEKKKDKKREGTNNTSIIAFGALHFFNFASTSCYRLSVLDSIRFS
jgi:hypothetical protein